MSAIRIQGEVYDGSEELQATILDLQARLVEMSSDTPEHEALARHIERLSEAYREAVGAEPGQGDSRATLENETGLAADADEPAPDHATAEDEAPDLESGLLCPVCGQEWDIPEAPPLDSAREQCPTCDGWGDTLTGSRVVGHAILKCSTCQGQGWVFKTGSEVRHINPVPSAAPEWPNATWNADTNQWNEPPGQAAPWEGARWNGYRGAYE